MALTPMMRQYLEIKDNYKDAILFFRLGDFYEMFFEDALTCVRELELTLTGKDCGLEERAPMCGIPFHSSENYIHRLIEKGYKVAICEQVEDPKEAKGIVKRDVVRIITPGTIINTQVLEDKKNNYLMALSLEEDQYGVSFMDISTGAFFVTDIIETKDRVLSMILDEMAKYMPSEMVVDEKIHKSVLEKIKQRFTVSLSTYGSWAFEKEYAEAKIKNHFKVLQTDSLGLQLYPAGTLAAGALLHYVQETQKVELSHISSITPYSLHDAMILDISSRRNLELTSTLREKSKKGSLLWVLDKTQTAMGGRLLRTWIEQPLIQQAQIQKRLDAVGELVEDMFLRDDLADALKEIYDLERLVSKMVYGTLHARDLLSLNISLERIPAIKERLSSCNSPLLSEISKELDTLEDCYDLIMRSIDEDAPLSVKEGNMIKEGFDNEIDKFKLAKKEGKNWILALENSEKEKTGIKNLKIGYNKVFGYYLEVTKSYYDLVPDYFIRKQTLANAERYITPELKEIESTVLGAEEKLVDLEYDLFVQIRNTISKEITRIQNTARYIATIDVLLSFANVSYRQNYCKPVIQQEGNIEIVEGRHPVVEKMIASEGFVTNNTVLDTNDNRFVIITGPNMAGKSTYMRQVALIVLMAQMGCFVPATSANISVVDRIFTRVGASDDLASGQSTFMVEMSEVANILHNATSKSLIILDEIGRGTSTYDGLSIAWSVVEYIHNEQVIGAKTLFATHYHELTELEDKLPGVKNYSISVKEHGDDIIFLRKIIRGGADHSYGIQVAKLAGLPNQVISRAKELLHELEENDIVKHPKEDVSDKHSKAQSVLATKEIVNETMGEMEIKQQQKAKKAHPDQFSLFDPPAGQEEHEVLIELRNMNLMKMTPMEAMNKLFELHCKANQ